MSKINSIHLSNFPDVSSIQSQDNLIADMDRVRDICNAALSIRGTENIRVRQPLASLKVVDSNPDRLKNYADLIKDEVNIKQVEFSSDIDQFAQLQLKINFPILGKRLPRKMKQIIGATKQGKWSKNNDGEVQVEGEILTKDECSLNLVPKDKNGTQSLSSNDALVILDLNITDELKIEGIARDLVRAIQQSRKDAGLDITDKITLSISCDNQAIIDATSNFSDYICEQTLANSVINNKQASFKNSFDHQIDGSKVVIGFGKI